MSEYFLNEEIQTNVSSCNSIFALKSKLHELVVRINSCEQNHDQDLFSKLMEPALMDLSIVASDIGPYVDFFDEDYLHNLPSDLQINMMSVVRDASKTLFEIEGSILPYC